MCGHVKSADTALTTSQRTEPNRTEPTMNTVTTATRATFEERKEPTTDVTPTKRDVDDDGSRERVNKVKKVFGSHCEDWAKLTDGGRLRARFSLGGCGVDLVDVAVTARFVSDVAAARSVARLVSSTGEAAECSKRVVAEDDGALECECDFDGVDLSETARHDALNVGAFEVSVSSGDKELGRAAMLTRVEQDAKGELRRLVLAYEAEFDGVAQGG